MISKRFTLATALMLAIALVPTLIHTYFELEYDDGRTTNTIPMNLAGFNSAPSERNADWARDIFSSDDWIERNYTIPDYGNIRLFAVRSYDLKRLYHHPELAIAYGINLDSIGIYKQENVQTYPIHVLKSSSGKDLVAYTLLYDGQFVSNPLTFQFQNSWQTLFSPRKEMTLFFVLDNNNKQNLPFDTTVAYRILDSSVRSFLAQQADHAN